MPCPSSLTSMRSSWGESSIRTSSLSASHALAMISVTTAGVLLYSPMPKWLSTFMSSAKRNRLTSAIHVSPICRLVGPVDHRRQRYCFESSPMKLTTLDRLLACRSRLRS